jgi:hypothetical protein
VTISASSFASLIGAECTAVIYYKWSAGVAAGNIKLQFIEGASTVKSETDLIPTPGSDWDRVETVPFPCPTAAVKLRLTSTTDAAVIKLDDAFLGRFELISVDGSGLAASLSMPTTANCDPDSASTTYVDLTDDTDCPGYTVDYLATGFTIDNSDFNNLEFNLSGPAGVYSFEMTATVSGSVVSSFAGLRISDGTTSCEGSVVRVINNGGSVQYPVTYICSIPYTAALSAVKIRTQGAVSTGSLDVQLGDARQGHNVKIHYTPLGGPRKAVKPDASSQFAAIKWSGTTRDNDDSNSTYTDITVAGWEGEQTLYGKAVDGPGTGTIEMTVPNIPAGTYEVSVSSYMASEGTSTDCFWRIYDATNAQTVAAQRALALSSDREDITAFKAPLTYGSFQSSVNFKLQSAMASGTRCRTSTLAGANTESYIILMFKSPEQNIPAPLLVNSTVNPRAGVTTIPAAKLNCDASSAILSDDGYVSSIGNISSGACAVTLDSVFVAAPNCEFTIDSASLDVDAHVNVTSPTAVSIIGIVSSTGAALSAFDGSLWCTEEKQ